MCGIVGILNRRGRPVGPSIIQQVTDSLAHRGPDGQGILLGHSLAFGHRRLSIIDPALGQQPMCNEDETVWITFNGEIYNYQALRIELEKHGHVFKTQSDTEVLVHGYEQWGNAVVEKCRGMFALCVVDLKRRKGLLAHDHFGIKPLYWRDHRRAPDLRIGT